MTYMGLLTSHLLGRIEFREEYFTELGSSHGAKHLFPDYILNDGLDENYRNNPIRLNDWQKWHSAALNNYSNDGVCIIRDGWNRAVPEIWNAGLETINDYIVLISSPVSKLDWIYCWMNTVSKIPRHVYVTLRQRSKFYPKLWAKGKLNLIPRHIKISEMISAMPIHPTVENIKAKNLFRFPTTEILREDFPLVLYEKLLNMKLNVRWNNDTLNWHRFFISLQMNNYERARTLVNDGELQSRGPFDDVLLGYLSNNDPWTTEEHPK